MAEDERDEAARPVGGWLTVALALAALSIVLTVVLTGVVRDVHRRADAVDAELDRGRVPLYGVGHDEGRSLSPTTP